MTLDEYFNQEDPLEFPHVVLNCGEYEVSTDNVMGWYRVFIPRIKESFNYVTGIYLVRKNDTRLYTIGENGSPTSISCFNLEKNIKQDN